jgi:hypothetical protein
MDKEYCWLESAARSPDRSEQRQQHRQEQGRPSSRQRSTPVLLIREQAARLVVYFVELLSDRKVEVKEELVSVLPFAEGSSPERKHLGQRSSRLASR